MKKFITLLLLVCLAYVGFGQDVTPTDATPWYGTTEFWVVLGGAALVVIEWILRVVPTSKPVGFLLKGIVALLQWLINRVPDKRKKV